MTDKPIDHERVLRITNVLKEFDLGDKEVALTILSNILKVYIGTASNKSIIVTQQEAGGKPGFTIANDGRGLQLFIPRQALDPAFSTSAN